MINTILIYNNTNIHKKINNNNNIITIMCSIGIFLLMLIIIILRYSTKESSNIDTTDMKLEEDESIDNSNIIESEENHSIALTESNNSIDNIEETNNQVNDNNNNDNNNDNNNIIIDITSDNPIGNNTYFANRHRIGYTPSHKTIAHVDRTQNHIANYSSKTVRNKK